MKEEVELVLCNLRVEESCWIRIVHSVSRMIQAALFLAVQLSCLMSI